MSESQALVAIQTAIDNQTEMLVSVLGGEKKAGEFRSNLLALCSTDNKLEKCESQSILRSALAATVMGLSLNQQLGYAYLVPFKGVAQLQVGWKGYVQLAIRSNQYARIASVVVYDGQLSYYNDVTGEFKYNSLTRKSNQVAGFLAYFRLNNGFEASLYMAKADMDAHSRKYSQSVKSGKESPWTTNYNEMGQKTVLKLLLKRFGVLDDAMQRAIELDQSAVTKDGKPDYIDTVATAVSDETPTPGNGNGNSHNGAGESSVAKTLGQLKTAARNKARELDKMPAFIANQDDRTWLEAFLNDAQPSAPVAPAPEPEPDTDAPLTLEQAIAFIREHGTDQQYANALSHSNDADLAPLYAIYDAVKTTH